MSLPSSTSSPVVSFGQTVLLLLAPILVVLVIVLAVLIIGHPAGSHELFHRLRGIS